MYRYGKESLNQLIAIALGGAFGSVARFGMSNAVYGLLGRGFPYGTLAVNLLGSLVIGFLYVILVERSALGPEWRALLIVGFLGGFTTFSSFSMETVTLLEEQAYLKAVLNVVGSVVLCLAATVVGLIVARKL
ncbi:MAG: CrcB protein [Halothiobacillaceae bacterium]|nr:MAG: CrcB protein [Halothiobacillaceae bacterium]